MNILGINAYHGDSAAALFSSGELVMAIEEERLNRVKHWAGLPSGAIRTCLRDAGDVDHVAISRRPSANLWRKLARVASHPGCWPRLSQRAHNSFNVANLGATLGDILTGTPKIHFVEHHRAHLASAFFASPFDSAAVVSIDGFGDFSSAMWGIGEGNRIRILGSVLFPHSLGVFYTAFTQFLGFPKYGDEYKMMGLAAYGEPSFLNQVRQVVRTRDGQCRLDLAYFTHHTLGVDMTWNGVEPVIGKIYSRRMHDTFGPSRPFGTEILPKHSNLAASVQSVLEENYFSLLSYVQKQTRQRQLCLAGGVALNCAANGKISTKTDFRELFIQPAAHDAGTCIGAALYVQHQVLKKPRSFFMQHVYYGPEYETNEIRAALNKTRVVYECYSEDDLINQTARAVAEGMIVGWFQGRMEFGPRALGSRSILADPRSAEMKDTLNRRIKYREPFRPFCPSILADAAGEYFETSYPAPFMVTAYKIRPHQQDRIPAVTHADGTGRLQTVEEHANPLYFKLIKRFNQITDVPILLNTSFNENEPIVNTPSEAIDCFLRTQMDALAIGPYFLLKARNLHIAEDRYAFAIDTRVAHLTQL